MKILVLIYTLLSLSFAVQSHAQTEKKLKSTSPERWFRVELVIFSHTNDNTDEKWPQNLKLQYSPNLVQLIDNQNHGHNSTSQLAGRQESGRPTPFKLLDDSQLELRAHARSLARKKGYQLLFHEAWDQPVLSAEEAPAIMITAGKEFGSHKTLEGEIKLSVARYLHFSTNLWLSEHETNDGESLFNGQSRLPNYPRFVTGSNDNVSEATSGRAIRGNETNVMPAFKLPSALELTNNNGDNDLLEPYLPSLIIQHKQHRRMRSKELHYLDNPRLGVLVKILPL